jgi:glycerol-3-phosphate dehydrogenase (NAD(P)+)
MQPLKIGIIGSGSWATAIAKIAVDNGNHIAWWVRQQVNIDYFKKRHHNPHYLRNAYFDVSAIHFSSEILEVIAASDVITDEPIIECQQQKITFKLLFNSNM